MVVETFGFLNLFGYDVVNFGVQIYFADLYHWTIQRLLPSHYHFPETAAVCGDLFITTVHPGCKSFLGLGHPNTQNTWHIRWWTDSLVHEHL
jgi:hypothetical protein